MRNVRVAVDANDDDDDDDTTSATGGKGIVLQCLLIRWWLRSKTVINSFYLLTAQRRQLQYM